MLTIEKDIDKIKEMLEGAGAEIMETVEVPFFSAGVPCGIPSVIGDETYETIAIPKEFVKLGCTFVVEARGNSMIGANIFEGDQLAIRAGANANSGDIVVAFIGGEATVKVYFKDEKGVSWLLPQNDMYEPIRIEGNKMNLNSREIPVKVYYEMTSEEGNAHILFISCSVYHHIDNIPANANKQNTLSADGQIQMLQWIG